MLVSNNFYFFFFFFCLFVIVISQTPIAQDPTILQAGICNCDHKSDPVSPLVRKLGNQSNFPQGSAENRTNYDDFQSRVFDGASGK